MFRTVVTSIGSESVSVFLRDMLYVSGVMAVAGGGCTSEKKNLNSTLG